MITSVYIHIPFCDNICTYCDFNKRFYNEEIVTKYLNALEEEIKEIYQNDLIKTIYIGGGTPSSLSVNNLKKLMKIVKIFKLDKNYEFSFECNPENINYEKLLLLKENGVNRISMGVESTNKKFLKYLNRHHDIKIVKEKIKLMNEIGFNNINVDLIYALPNETINDLKKDLDIITNLSINHISTYSLEIHHHTILGINKVKPINEDLDCDMYNYICNYLKEKGFNHYEISNFCKDNTYSNHNLVYWHNDNYYGFGMGASGYIKNIRYTNTRSYRNYINKKRIIYKETLIKKDRIIYELILGFRLINGINKDNFKKKYQKELIQEKNIQKLIKKGYLEETKNNIKIKEKYLYIENSILEEMI